MGAELCRIELDDEGETGPGRAIAEHLARTAWRTSPTLEIIPYIDGAPAGTPKPAEVVWLERTLFVEPLPRAKLARLVPERLGKVFGRSDVTAALNYCFGRTADDVTEYVEENFKLAARTALTISEFDTPLRGVPPTQHPAEEPSSNDLRPPGDAADGVVTPAADPIEATTGTSPEPADEFDEHQDELDGMDKRVTKGAPRSETRQAGHH